MELESIILSEISQAVNKKISYDLTYKCNLIDKTKKKSTKPKSSK